MTGHQVALAARVRAQVCRHTDGVAIGSTMAALVDHGALEILAGRERTPFGRFCNDLRANAGFLHVAIRLLADQGWVRLRGGPAVEELIIEPTVRGRVVFTELADGYRFAAEFLPVAQRIDQILEGADDGDLRRYVGLMRRQWDLPSRDVLPEARRQVLSHLRGHLMAPLMLAATRRGMLQAGVDIPIEDRPMSQVVGILAWQGWAQTSGNTAWLTPEGEMALAYARQYVYPLVYLPLLRRVPDLIFGNPGRSPDADETHLDRALDVRFSGDVFNAVCRRPFLAMALPLFNRTPLEDQPTMVVDTGCGDGTALMALYAAVCANTERGRNIADHPLLMVGVDPSAVVRKIAAERLSAAGVPHLLLDGDIADPARLRRDLDARGLDVDNALHMCKSAIHDRAFQEPSAALEPGPSPPVSYSAFASPDGADIPATKIARSLAELFGSWRTLTQRHGWLVIEAQATPAATTARLLGRSVTTSLDSTHGYSCQYLVEPQVFEWAARAAGFSSRGHAEPGAAQLGHTVLTIDHLVADR